MKMRAGVAALAAAATAAATGTAITLSGITFAAFSDTVTSTPTTIGAATVVLGHGDGGPELSYAGLQPGTPQSVELTVTYEGTVAADLSLAVTPDGEAAFCAEGPSGWTARPGSAITVQVGTGDPVPYCDLYTGARLPLGTAEPGTALTATITIALDAGAVPSGLTETDVATVHADGGFTDRATGSITVATAAPPDAPDPAAVEALPGPLTPATAEDPVPPGDQDPALLPDAASPEPGAVPAECRAAGMTAEQFAEVVVLTPGSPPFDATIRPGPVLVLGTPGPDDVTGSAGADCIVGGGGADDIDGGPGDDVLAGGPGLDGLVGGSGHDRLDGGPDDATCDAGPEDHARWCLAPRPTEQAPLTPTPSAAPQTSPAQTAPAQAPRSTEPAPATAVAPQATLSSAPATPDTPTAP